jgi:hypothetical protein
MCCKSFKCTNISFIHVFKWQLGEMSLEQDDPVSTGKAGTLPCRAHSQWMERVSKHSEKKKVDLMD